MARSAEMRRGDMEEATKENETLIPAMEDAETVAMSAEEREAVQAEAETLKASQADTITMDDETVRVGLKAEQVGTPEVPKNLETGDGYREDFVDDTTEVIDPMANAREMPREDVDDVELGADPATLAVGSKEAFDAALESAQLMGFDMGPERDVSFDQYTDWKLEENELQKKVASVGFFKKMFGLGGEKMRLRQLQGMIDRVETVLHNAEMAGRSTEEGSLGSTLRERQSERREKTKKAGTGGFGR